ncbi:unnamed protein product, partial [Ascophyllum nodosum]
WQHSLSASEGRTGSRNAAKWKWRNQMYTPGTDTCLRYCCPESVDASPEQARQ